MDMENDNYCIRQGYSTASLTNSSGTGAEFWTPSRIRQARENLYQYPVYLHGKKMIVENGLRSVLDIGCGLALKLETVIGPVCNDVTAMDQEGIIEYCRRRADFAQFIVYDIDCDPFPLTKTFDLIICADVIEHLHNPDKLLASIRSASSNETFILLSTPERNTVRGKGCLCSPKSAHVREWNYKEFAKYITSRGFMILGHSLVPPMRFAWSRIYFWEVWRQLLHLRRFSYCQMIVCKKRTEQT